MDEARKLTNLDDGQHRTVPGEAIRVKYVLNARKSSHGLLVWKRRWRRKRPGSSALRSLRSTLLNFLFFKKCSVFRYEVSSFAVHATFFSSSGQVGAPSRSTVKE